MKENPAAISQISPSSLLAMLSFRLREGEGERESRLNILIINHHKRTTDPCRQILDSMFVAWIWPNPYQNSTPDHQTLITLGTYFAATWCASSLALPLISIHFFLAFCNRAFLVELVVNSSSGQLPTSSSIMTTTDFLALLTRVASMVLMQFEAMRVQTNSTVFLSDGDWLWKKLFSNSNYQRNHRNEEKIF